MDSLDWNEFRRNLLDSGLATADELTNRLGQGDIVDVRQAARVLVKAGLLTEWQAKFLLSGRSRLKIGGFVLLDRLRRDELGDHFLARQTALDRRVDILILSNELAADPTYRQRFLDCAARLTQLDHPRLEHVYDVRQEADRLYVVSEFVEGEEWSQIKAIQTQPALHRLQWLQDWTSACEHAEQQGISLHKLTERDLVLDQWGHGKIVNLVAMSLRAEVFDPTDSQLALPNYHSVARVMGGVAVQLLNGIDLREFADISRTASAMHQGASDRWPEFRKAVSAAFAQVESVAAARTPAQSVGNTRSGVAEEPPVRTASRSHLWLRIAAVVVVILAAGVLAKNVWFSSRTPNESLTQSSLDVNEQNDHSAPSGRSSTRSSRSNRQKSAAEKNDPFVVNIDHPEVLVGTDSQAITNPTENNPRHASAPAQVDIPGQGSAPEQTATASGQMPGSSENRIAQSEPPLQDEVKQDSTAPKKDPFVVPGVSGVAGSGQPGESGPRTNPANGTLLSSPLAGLLPSVALANTESQATQVLGTLAAESLGSLRVDYLSDPETVGRGKLYFSLSIDTSRDHSWRLDMQRQSTDQALEPIANLNWREGQFEFAWRPDLDAKSPANFIVNGLFRFRHGDHERLVRLREPVVIPPVALSGEALSSRSMFDIDWLPQSFQIELGALTVENGWERVHIEPTEWTPRQPLTFRFRTAPEEQLFWLVGQADTRNRIGFSLETMSALSQRPIKRKDLDQTVEMLNQRYQFLVEAEARAKLEADNAPYGQKTKARERANEARALANEGRRAREIANEAREAVLQIVDRELPLRIVYSFGDYHIELARSSNFTEPKKN